MKNAPIGIFDSGVGGLTVVREVMRQIPGEEIVYFGDTARVPYGSKTPATVLRYARQIVHFLKTQQVKAIVVACNTASALALPAIREEEELPVMGVVEPGAHMAAMVSRTGRIGVIGTEATVHSGIYEQMLQKLAPQATVIPRACPLLCPIVEEGMLHDPVTDEIVRRYLAPLMEEKIDTLIMGCTHYPLLRSTFRRILGDTVELINPAYETAVALKAELGRLGLLRGEAADAPAGAADTAAAAGEKEQPAGQGAQAPALHHRFCVSDGAERFAAFAQTILPCEVGDVQVVNIEAY